MLSSCLSLVASLPEANEAIGASSQGRSRYLAAYEYGPPLFQIGDMVKIMKDTTPGVHWRYSYYLLGQQNKNAELLRELLKDHFRSWKAIDFLAALLGALSSSLIVFNVCVSRNPN